MNNQLIHSMQHIKTMLKETFGLPKYPTLTKANGTQGLTYIMNQEMVVKIPRNSTETRQLESLMGLLHILKHKTKVQTPNLNLLRCSGVENQKPQEVFIGYYPLLKGKLFSGMDVFYDQDIFYRENVVGQLGTFVADLQSLSDKEVLSLKIPTARDYLHNVLFQDFNDMTHDVPVFKRRALLNGVYHHIFEGCDSRVLCHMDLHVQNICLDESMEKMTAVFDFGRAVVGPRELEFLHMASLYDEELDAFEKGYKQSKGCTDEIFETPHFRRVAKYLSPFSREKELPRLIQEFKVKT